MNAERLTQLGFTLMAGKVDRGGKNYGVFTSQGVILDPDGEELVRRLEEGDDPDLVRPGVMAPPAPAPRPAAKQAARAKTNAKPAADPEDPLSGLQGELSI